MAWKNELTRQAIGKPLPEWIGKLARIKTEQKSLSISDLARELDMTVKALRSVLSTILEPDEYDVIAGRSHALYYVKFLVELGNKYNDGLRYRLKQKQEMLVV